MAVIISEHRRCAFHYRKEEIKELFRQYVEKSQGGFRKQILNISEVSLQTFIVREESLETVH